MQDTIDKVYQNIKSTLKTAGFDVSGYKTINYGLQFTVAAQNRTGIIRIYQNKKSVIKIDYSQLKQGEFASKIQTLIESKRTIFDSKKSDAVNFELEYPIIGTDESGKGDYFGPLVSAGVYVDVHSAKKLTACGVSDSKKLSDNRNMELAREIKKICGGRFAIIEISPERYNGLYEQFIKDNQNLNNLLAWGHAKAIEVILAKVDCKTAIADKFGDESYILDKLQEKGKRLKLIQRHKAEQNIAVASASVLARARFLEKLSKLSKEFKIELPKGASQQVIETGKKLIDKHGKEALKKVAKLHFRTTKNILALISGPSPTSGRGEKDLSPSRDSGKLNLKHET